MLDPVAKSELLGEPDGRVSDREDASPFPDFLDDRAFIVPGHFGLNPLHHFRSADIDLLGFRSRIRHLGIRHVTGYGAGLNRVQSLTQQGTV